MVRGSWGKDGGSKVDRGGRRTRGSSRKKEEGITEETREFVVNYDYSSEPDPFIEIRGNLVQVKQEPRDEEEEEDNVDLDAFVNQLINEEDGGGGDQEEDEEVPLVKSDFAGETSADPDWQPEEDDSDLEEFEEDNRTNEAVKEGKCLVKGSDIKKPTTSSSKSSTVPKQKRPARKKKSLEDEGAFLLKGQICYKCVVEDCGMILKSRRNYNRHKLRWHSGNKKGPQGHEAAFRTETGQLRYKCPVEGCGKIVKQRHNYESHKLHVHEGVPYPPKEKLSLCCDQCGKAFESWGGLRTHRKRVHEGILEPSKVSEAAMKRKMEKIQCAHCPRMVSRCVMAHHVKIRHTEGFSHYCQVCGQTAKSSKEFKSHQADKHGLCSMPECKLKVFGGREELWKHQVEVHDKEVDIFRCLDCGKCFTIKTRLGRHQKSL